MEESSVKTPQDIPKGQSNLQLAPTAEGFFDQAVKFTTIWAYHFMISYLLLLGCLQIYYYVNPRRAPVVPHGTRTDSLFEATNRTGIRSCT